MTRQAVFRYMKSLIQNGSIATTGNTRSRTYTIRPIYKNDWHLTLLQHSEEDKVWRDYLKPQLQLFPENIRRICQYGFTEMFNNVIDHSEGSNAKVLLEIYPDQIGMTILDNGVGIFNKIQKYLKLNDPLDAILEIAKGKLSTDPDHHSGEGIFFTARMFDSYMIASSNLCFYHTDNNGFDIMKETKESYLGTSVVMEISPFSTRTPEQVFNEFSKSGSYNFDRTVIPVILGSYSDENLVSRSQARRLLARVNRFKQVVFDFAWIDTIGQAFADEIFRVYANENPSIQLSHLNANEKVLGMINRVLQTD